MIRNFNRDTGDIVTSGVQFLEDGAATGNGVYHRLRMFFGEWFLDISDGTDWFGSVLGKAPQDEAEIALKQRILSAPDVSGIESFNFDSDRDTRRIVVECTIIDASGEAVSVTFDEVI